MVGLSGFEPLTSRLSAVRSSQLSYRPVVDHSPGAHRASPAAALRRGLARVARSQRTSPRPEGAAVAL
jgi:hypothetical protein